MFVVTVIERGAEQMVFREYSCRGMPLVKLLLKHVSLAVAAMLA